MKRFLGARRSTYGSVVSSRSQVSCTFPSIGTSPRCFPRRSSAQRFHRDSICVVGVPFAMFHNLKIASLAALVGILFLLIFPSSAGSFTVVHGPATALRAASMAAAVLFAIASLLPSSGVLLAVLPSTLIAVLPSACTPPADAIPIRC